ncbi:hypothetical protein PINS_up006994 [Pythium insidiosum]|nr:hypothetical protein PINS_up006994 [Pythium insidiosum]
MGEKSILSALAIACVPEQTEELCLPSAPARRRWIAAVTQAYSQLPDYGALATVLSRLAADLSVLHAGDDTDSLLDTMTERLLRDAAPVVGTPVLPMAAYPLASVREALDRLRKAGSGATCEHKYDGARVQLHWRRRDGSGRIFSRNLEDQTTRYGSLLETIASQVSSEVQELVVEGEVVAIDRVSRSFLPFQVLQQVSPDDSTPTAELCLYMFDLLTLNGENWMNRSLFDRRRALSSVLHPRSGHLELVTSVDLSFETDSEQEQEDKMLQALRSAVESGCEGLMVKTLHENSAYRAGARSFAWMKLKQDYLASPDQATASGDEQAQTKDRSHGTFLPDTLDLVPVAAYFGRGRRAGQFGSFLLASYDSSTGRYETIGKVGSGFSDAALAELSDALRDDIMPDGPSPLIVSAPSQARPDVWCQPRHVWEIKATQVTRSPSYMTAHSLLSEDTDGSGAARRPKGLGLRFPRFVRVRSDKSAEQATDSAEMARLFRLANEAPGSSPTD